MKQELVEINLHGAVFEGFKNQFKLAVKSCAEAIYAINIMTKNKFFAQLLENDKKNIKYEILINKNPCLFAEPPDINKPETLLNSELVVNYPNLKTIDIVPIIEGAEDVGLIIAGVLLIALTIWNPGGFFGGPLGFALIMGGLGLIAAGIINLLTTPPKLDDFKTTARKGSYLFDGPENAVGEGGPVPLVYGQLLVGSQTIEVTINNSDQAADALLSQGDSASGFGGGGIMNIKAN